MKTKRGFSKFIILVLMFLVFSVFTMSSVNADSGDKQVFDINLTEIQTSNNSENLSVKVFSSINGVEVNNPIKINFSVNYTNVSGVLCNISQGGEILKENINISEAETPQKIGTKNLSDKVYSWELSCKDIKNLNQSSSKSSAFLVNESLSISGLKETYTTEEDIVFNLPDGYDEGKITNNGGYLNITSEEIELKKNNYFSHLLGSSGEYEIKITAYSEEGPVYKATREITIEEAGDTSPPEIELLYPTSNQVVNKSKINFWFEVKDESKLENYTFELYVYSKEIGILTSNYSKTFSDINEKEVRKKVPMVEFEEGEYYWEVYSCDKEGNCNELTEDYEYGNEFAVNLSSNTASTTDSENSNYSHNRSDEIEELRNALSSFMEKMESYDSEKIKAMETLGIAGNLNYYQKQLNRIDKLLGKGFDGFNEKDREEVKKETLNKLEKIKNNIPESITIDKTEEYVKNSVTDDLFKIIGQYAEAKNLKISEKETEKLAELNRKLQNQLSVSTKVSQITIEYNQTEEDKKVTLVNKKISLENKSYETFIEFIPEELSSEKIEFLVENEKLSDKVYKIKNEKINNSITYTIEGYVEPENLKDTQTILFNYFSTDMSGITGLFTLDLESKNPLDILLFLIIAAVVIYAGYRIYRRIQVSNWQKYPNVVRTKELINKAKNNLKFNDLNSARDNYHKIRETFPLLPEGFKKYIASDVKKIRVGIDKRDISGMVKEYEKAKDAGRREDAKELYKKIKSVYKRLPERYQEKIYQRMFKPKIEF